MQLRQCEAPWGLDYEADWQDSSLSANTLGNPYLRELMAVGRRRHTVDLVRVPAIPEIGDYTRVIYRRPRVESAP